MSSSGSFATLTTPDVVREIIAGSATGRLRVAVGHQRKVVWFEKGRPVAALSTDPAESLGERLVRTGRLAPESLREALRRAPSIKKVGPTLVALGDLTPRALYEASVDLAREIVLSLFVLDRGQFVFEDAPLDPDEVVRLDLDVESLLREGIRRMTEPALLLRALGSLEEVVEPAPPPERAPSTPLGERERGVLAAIGASRATVREVCRRTNLPAIETCRTLVALVTLGHARRA